MRAALRHCLLASFVAAFASPASANFHVAHIERIMSGQPDGDVQFVEIVMESTSQHVTSGSKLAAFDSAGVFSHVITSVGGNVSSGSDRPWIMASQGFAAAAGITPDFTFDASEGKGLIPEDGMVCWGKPINQTVANQYVDCVSYGNYTGADNNHTSAPHPLNPFGRALARVAHTHNSATDFACEDPAAPRNNVPATGSIAAQIPCSCGDDTLDEGEDCDGEDDVACPGACSSACLCVVLCGDANDDGEIKATDALAILRAAVGNPTPCPPSRCDVDDNGSILASDSLRVLRVAVGTDLELVCPAV